MARVLAISSHVVHGQVGLAATVPALQWLGHEVWALPTVMLASRPGLGRLVRHELPTADLSAMLAALEADGRWPSIDAVFTGYFPSAAAVAAVAPAIARIKAANPAALVCVDPILGDAGRLYVARETAEAIGRELLPLATVATPNLFELEWLTGSSGLDRDGAAAAAKRLMVPMVAVTSAAETAESISTLLITPTSLIERARPHRPGIPNGAGDLFAGLLLGHLLRGATAEAALDASLATLDRVLAASSGKPVLQLAALTTGTP